MLIFFFFLLLLDAGWACRPGSFLDSTTACTTCMIETRGPDSLQVGKVSITVIQVLMDTQVALYGIAIIVVSALYWARDATILNKYGAAKTERSKWVIDYYVVAAIAAAIGSILHVTNIRGTASAVATAAGDVVRSDVFSYKPDITSDCAHHPMNSWIGLFLAFSMDLYAVMSSNYYAWRIVLAYQNYKTNSASQAMSFDALSKQIEEAKTRKDFDPTAFATQSEDLSPRPINDEEIAKTIQTADLDVNTLNKAAFLVIHPMMVVVMLILRILFEQFNLKPATCCVPYTIYNFLDLVFHGILFAELVASLGLTAETYRIATKFAGNFPQSADVIWNWIYVETMGTSDATVGRRAFMAWTIIRLFLLSAMIVWLGMQMVAATAVMFASGDQNVYLFESTVFIAAKAELLLLGWTIVHIMRASVSVYIKYEAKLEKELFQDKAILDRMVEKNKQITDSLENKTTAQLTQRKTTSSTMHLLVSGRHTEYNQLGMDLVAKMDSTRRTPHRERVYAFPRAHHLSDIHELVAWHLDRPHTMFCSIHKEVHTHMLDNIDDRQQLYLARAIAMEHLQVAKMTQEDRVHHWNQQARVLQNLVDGV